MQILVLTHEYPPIGGGGGRVAQDLCLSLAKRGHSVTILTANCDQLPEHETQDGVQIIRLNSGRKEPFRANFKAMLGYIWASFWFGLKLVRRSRPDVMHVHFAVPAGVSAFLISLLTGVPYVLTAHLGDVPGGVPEKTGKWFRWIFPFTPPIWRKAAAIAAVSEFTRSLALKKYPVPIEVIPNGVDTDSLDPGQISVHQPPKIVFSGRFMPQKDPIFMIQCLAQVKDLPWTCTLIGDGPLRDQMTAEIEKLEMNDRFTFTGWVDPEQVIEEYRAADIMFMPSLSEGMPVVGVQALSMGLALVLSHVGGCVELVDEGQNGYLFEPKEIDGISFALRKLLTDQDLLLDFRKASRKKAKYFSLQNITLQYEALLQTVVARE